MIKGKTSTGFFFTLSDNVLDNMELIDALAELENDKLSAASKACLLLLGQKTRDKLYNHLRTPDGRVPATAVISALGEIMGAVKGQGKN